MWHNRPRLCLCCFLRQVLEDTAEDGCGTQFLQPFSPSSISPNPSWISSTSLATASGASEPSATILRVVPLVAARRITDMMLLASTVSEPLDTSTLLLYLLANSTNCIAGRACSPYL